MSGFAPDPTPPLPFADNVFLDPVSAHRWDQLNESLFLERVFAALRPTMPDFGAYRFYVFSPAVATAVPASAAFTTPNRVLLFLSDESASVPDALAASFTAIFKAYLPDDRERGNIFPLSLGYVKDVPAEPPLPMAERPIDLFFSGNLNANRVPLYCAFHPRLRFLPRRLQPVLAGLLKTAVRRFIRRDFGDGTRRYVRFTGGFREGVAPAEYARLLARSRVVLCPKGFQSAETFRHVESLRAGAVVVSEPLPDTRLYRDGPFVIVRDWREGLRAVDELLADPAALALRQAAGIVWYAAKLSETATADFIAATLARLTDSGRSEGLSARDTVL